MVIGIDGVPYELVQELANKGILPNFKKLINKYGLIKTRAPLPEISSVSWTSFMTGANPGEHGVYGFMELNREDYSYIYPSFRTLTIPVIWESPANTGKRAIIINLPGTYPARPLNGILVSGFVAIDLDKSIYPVTFLPLLKKMNYRIDADIAMVHNDKAKFLKDLKETLGIRYHLYKKFETTEQWNLFFFIITGTDRLHHFFYNALDSREAPFHKDFIDYYQQVDHIIGEITGDMEKRGIPFIILSDHGFVKMKQEVYLSQYLKSWGYLEMGEKKPENLESLLDTTRIFAIDPSRLYIHLEGKYKRGRVKKEDYNRLREEIKTNFSDLEIEGEKVIKNVYFKEEIYSGSFFENAPDLVLVSHHGFDLKAGITKETYYGRTLLEGMHSQDNAMLIDACDLELTKNPVIYEIGKQLIL